MKTVPILILIAALATGCTTVVTPTGQKATFLNSNWGVVNNTLFSLTVVQDGATVAVLEPGQAVTLPPSTWREASLVSVSARFGGHYMGASTYTFSRYTVYNWQVDSVQLPGGSQ